MRRVEHLIKQGRRFTENEQLGVTDGILDMEFVEYINNAQDSMVVGIYKTNNDLLTKEYQFNAVARQEEYNLPFDIFTNSHIIDFSWSRTGQLRDLRSLEKVSFKERYIESGDPDRYILRGGIVLVNKIPPSSTQLGLMSYNPRLPRLDIRRGKVSAVVLDVPNLAVTSITLDSAFDVTLANALFDEADYLTVVSRDGDIKMKSIPISDVDTTTGVMTLESGFVYEAGETIAVGDYVCLGKYSTTHCSLPEICERYLLEYLYKRIFFRDSSDDWQIASSDLQETRAEIIGVIGLETSDVTYIPILDSESF